ncbi:DEAD/DEAH box helicase family protein, partial [Enterococcus cecorum]
MTRNVKVQNFIDVADSYIEANNYTEKQLDKAIQELLNIPMYSDFSKEEISFIQDKLRDRLSISYSDSFVVIGSSQHEPWFDEAYGKINDVTRWDRYIKYLRKCKNFSPSVIQDMRKNLFKIIDLLGNPLGKNFRRKGLVVGDVQSGKTANYIGLMNLAADMKYKIIIVLTGTTNTLREQTQQRIYEGMGKANSKDGVNSITINSYSKDQHPVYLTSIEQDFNKNTSTGFQTSVGSTTAPIIIVTKKNTSSLKNIKSWLDDYSKDINKDYIDYSLLLIDDEADFASVNTKDESEGESPTIINRRIREILELFTKSSYIGFTATPFANVFINPNTEDEMFGQDLFPKDYIYVLGQPSNYIGIHSIFSDSYDDEEENYSDMIEIID